MYMSFLLHNSFSEWMPCFLFINGSFHENESLALQVETEHIPSEIHKEIKLLVRNTSMAYLHFQSEIK